jgi:hypothetical protein
MSEGQKKGGKYERTLSEGMAIDAKEDEGVREKTIREFEITDVGESRVCHGGREGNDRGNRLLPQLISSLHRSTILQQLSQ